MSTTTLPNTTTASELPAMETNTITPTVKTVPLSSIKFDETLYPRRDGHSPTLVQKYAEVIDQIEAHKKYISIAADGTLMDGRHRQLAYTKVHQSAGNDPEVPVFFYDIHDRGQIFDLACELNASHGDQLTREDKKANAVRMYREFNRTQQEIAAALSMSLRLVNEALKDVLKQQREDRDKKIVERWMRCDDRESIATAVDVSGQTVSNVAEEWQKNYRGNKFAIFSEEDWKPQLYNIWNFHKLSNSTGHFGNTEQAIVDQLLYMYTEPFDIVVDPFGGGGSTIDVCKKRLRRYWVSDRLPIPERTDIRQAEIADGPPALHKRWQDVSLMYLDPPYWKQAANQYSNDANDLANMELDQFYDTLVGYVQDCAAKMKPGSHIALIIQPTQWLANGRVPIDHVFDLVQKATGRKLKYVHRIICPYSSEQYNAQQVNWAKENRTVLTLNRELIVWEVQ